MTRSSKLAIAFIACLWTAASGGPQIVRVVPSNSPDDLFAAARLKITGILKETAASGIAVAVAKEGKILWEQGFGFTARGGKAPVTPDTMFSLASITKSLTATGLMVLCDRGLVDLDKPANAYLGQAKLTACFGGSTAATIKNLIYHTSGLPMHYHLFYADKPRRPPDMDESIRRYGILTSPPGESYVYSNFGYGILGDILARVSGKPYAAFMREEVFEPLGMTRTWIVTEPDGFENVAVKYGAGKRKLPVCDFDHRGASAAYASVHDLVRFGMFHLGESLPGQRRILKAATLAAMHRQSGAEFLDSGLEVEYLLGSLGRLEYRGTTILLATGGMPGVVSRLDIIPSMNIVSAVLANADDVDLWALQREIFGAFLPAFRDTPGQPSRTRAVGVREPLVLPDALLGRWSGTIRAFQKDISAALIFMKGGPVTLEIDGIRYSPLSVRTELGDMSCKDGTFRGLFWGRIETPDTAGQRHAVYVKVALRAGRLSGTASAVSIDARRTFFLPYCLELARPAGESKGSRRRLRSASLQSMSKRTRNPPMPITCWDRSTT
jgi:CubicO group peptidase (beta-lactamase class C family)